jgi:VWFA-related protein
MYRFTVALALSAICLFADDAPLDSAKTFKSDVTLVRVDARVVDAQNHSIRGLTPEDFVLREAGKQQEVRKVVAEALPVDVILLLDVSRSMEPHVERVASAAHQALRALGDQDRVAVLVFDRGTRVRMPFRNSRQETERELNRVIDQETFEGGTDITRGLVDAANYMTTNARKDARHAIVIVTDDQTEMQRNDASVLHALTRADAVLSALIAPDALHTGSTRGTQDDQGLEDMLRRMLPREFSAQIPAIFGPHTRSAGTANIAQRSGGDSVSVDEASALEKTLARIRERYALYFYLPEGAKPGDEMSVQVELSPAARQRYPGAQVQYRNSYVAPNGSRQSQEEDTDSSWV